MTPHLLDLGDTALTLEFGDRIDLALNNQVMAARDALPHLTGITDLVPSYRSLTVHFDPSRLPRTILAEHLLRVAEAPPQKSALATRWLIPALFNEECGPDLSQVAVATGRDQESVIETLCSTELHVFLIGFLPGFPYMGELPEWLRLPRLATPRTQVPANSVAIAGAQAAVYPWQSPGGWHLLGRTPVRLFDLTEVDQPALFAPGDSVRFMSISASEFARISGAVNAGELGRDAFFAP
jgi:KipI family sensor histidine kinase inhibitor